MKIDEKVLDGILTEVDLMVKSSLYSTHDFNNFLNEEKGLKVTEDMKKKLKVIEGFTQHLLSGLTIIKGKYF